MSTRQAVELARNLFLSETNTYGCAETSFVTLKMIYGLPQAEDSAAAMALNGGVAWQGEVCGALSGAGMALGLLAAQRIHEHHAAKRTARLLLAEAVDAFQQEFHHITCRDLIELDIRQPEQHQQFINSGIWRDRCMCQIEFVVSYLAPLADRQVWDEKLRSLGISA
jgi:C_GCAxxG_C_C family probable redox protein